MPTRSTWIEHKFAGGWATDFGPTYYGSVGQDGQMAIPFLLNARNIIYEFDGGPHKAPGTIKYNAATLGATSDIRGVYDYWRQGTGGSPVQKLIACTDTRIVQGDVSGNSFTNLFTGLGATGVPQFSTFDDILIIGFDSIADVPRSWDGTTAQNLAGSPPRFSFSVSHKNRQWAAGNYALPSRLYYSANVDPEDWTGVGSGSIDINPNDGDMITGLVSHKDNLIVFKGPNIGSIHRISGSSPTGSDAFAVIPFISGVGAHWINSIFRYGDDIGFLGITGAIHSLTATLNFGDFTQSYLSYPIGSWLRDNVSLTRARYIWAANDPVNSRIYITFTQPGATSNNAVLVMDYRFLLQGERYPRWALWDNISFGSMGMIIDTNRKKRVFMGGYTGYVYKGDQVSRSIDGTSISMQVTTPFLTYGDEWREKTISAAALNIRPYNNNNITFGWQRDLNTSQSQTVTQGGGVLLDTFLLDTDILGSSKFIPRFLDLELGGQFRAIQYDITDSANNSDLELHTFAARIIEGSESTEN
jgi:hypothetical protein